MSTHVTIGDLHLDGMKDLCVIKDGDPPFSFSRDLEITPARPEIHYQAPRLTDTHTFWGPK